MKYLVIISAILSNNSYAQSCLIRTGDILNPELRVAPFSDADFRRPIYINSSSKTADCINDACSFSQDDVFILNRKGAGHELIWAKNGSEHVRFAVYFSSYSEGSRSIDFLKSESSNGYTYYLIRNGTTKCQDIPRWKHVSQYHDKDCGLYTIEAFESNPNQAMQEKYIEPDDTRAKLQSSCGGPTQPGTGSGGEPPP